MKISYSLLATLQKTVALAVQVAFSCSMTVIYKRLVKPYAISYTTTHFDIKNVLHDTIMTFSDPNLFYKFSVVYLLALSQYIIISETIDFMAGTVYKSIPYLNDAKRPQKNRIGRMIGYTSYSLRWVIPIFCGYMVWFHPLFIDQERNIKLSVKYYVWLGCHVQLSLAFADFFYGAWHHMQHKWKKLYYLTGHDYHHQFHLPYAREGTWLCFIDLWVSSSLIGLLNIWASSLILGKPTIMEFFLELGLVHEMNGCDHSGKVLPFHSGVPFFPPLSRLFGFDKSVQAHEAHHNLGRLSYGLLGLYDRVAGTYVFAKT